MCALITCTLRVFIRCKNVLLLVRFLCDFWLLACMEAVCMNMKEPDHLLERELLRDVVAAAALQARHPHHSY